jgi:hypothetical protein
VPVSTADPSNAIAAAVGETARHIHELGESLPVPFRERQMQALLVAELRRTTADDIEVKENLHIHALGWPGVGPVDIALRRSGDEVLAYLELKWGAGTLYNCIWDVAKMGLTHSLGDCPFAYLVAGAPLNAWTSGDGSELFSDGEWQTSVLYDRYATYWAYWKKSVTTHPETLPEILTTTVVASERCTVNGAPWEVRCVQVERVGELLCFVQPSTEGPTPERWRDHFSFDIADVDFLSEEEVNAILRRDEEHAKED